MRESIADQNHILDLATILKARWLVMLAAYLDESEQSQDGVFVVAGYVFDPRSCQKFDKRWQEILARWHVSEFHMADFAHRKGDFAGWSEGTRISFLDRLIQTIHANAKFHVVVGIDARALSGLSPIDKAPLLDLKKYSITATHFQILVRKALSDPEPVAYIFDEAPRKSGKEVPPRSGAVEAAA